MSDKQVRDPFHWQSAISYKTRERIVVRGYDVNELTGNISFAEMVHLVWKGNLPDENTGKMINAMLVCFAEHAMSPSSASARMVMSGAGYIMPGLAGDHVKFVVALENATETYWGRKLYMNVSGAISSTLVDMGFTPDECLAFCAIARSVSLVAHCLEEKTREKGWRASSNSTITQPLDLELQKPDYYDGPAERHLPDDKITNPLERAPYHYIEPSA